ncbi:MAG: glycosyltransferase [Lachnospiraceae bacterium]|nr:glycosyltransferase [Lachnospiraceae bacterium]
MRIAMFTNNYKPFVGGVPISVEHLAEALRERGHFVYVFAPSYKGQEEEEFVIRYPSFRWKVGGAPVPNVLTGLLRKKVEELDIDVIHVHHPALVGNVALSIRRKLGIPVVFTYHTKYEEYLHYLCPVEIPMVTGLLRWNLHRFCDGCDYVFAPTPGIMHYLEEEAIKTPVSVVPTGLPEGNYYTEKTAVAALRKNYLRGADYLFCTVARLAKEKNLSFLLRGLSLLREELKKDGKTFRHIFIGEGPLREELPAEAECLGLADTVEFLGNVPNGEVKNYLAASELFLFASKSETQGIVLLESMAVGTPVIAVKASGVCDIVNGKNGMLTEEREEVWAKAVKDSLADRGRYKNLCAGAKKTAASYREREVAAAAENGYCRAIG